MFYALLKMSRNQAKPSKNTFAIETDWGDVDGLPYAFVSSGIIFYGRQLPANHRKPKYE